jgi:hypothetical protein
MMRIGTRATNRPAVRENSSIVIPREVPASPRVWPAVEMASNGPRYAPPTSGAPPTPLAAPATLTRMESPADARLSAAGRTC